MKTIVIVGVGALGSHVVQFARNFEARLRLIDFDRVERKNVLSQFHGQKGVGKNKVQSVAQVMQFLFGQKVEGVPHKLTADNVEQLLGGADIIVDCLDNGEARRLVQGFVSKTGTPCLHGALAADGAYGMAVWDGNGRIGFRVDDEPGGGAATCEDGEHLPFIAITSAYMARSIQQFLLDGTMVGYHVHPGGVTKT
jgi:molybdopterin-synthase adenylyltransferase